MAYHIEHEAQCGRFKVKLTGTAAVGLMASIPNPEGVRLLVTRAFLYFDTPAAGAAQLHMGVGAADADSHDIVDGLTLNKTAYLCYQLIGGPVQVHASDFALVAPVAVVWEADTFLNFTTDTVISTAFVGYLFVEYTRLVND